MTVGPDHPLFEVHQGFAGSDYFLFFIIRTLGMGKKVKVGLADHLGRVAQPQRLAWALLFLIKRLSASLK